MAHTLCVSYDSSVSVVGRSVFWGHYAPRTRGSTAAVLRSGESETFIDVTPVPGPAVCTRTTTV